MEDCLPKDELDKLTHSCRQMSDDEEAEHFKVTSSLVLKQPTPTHGSEKKLKKWRLAEWSKKKKKPYDINAKAKKRSAHWKARSKHVSTFCRLRKAISKSGNAVKVAKTVPKFLKLPAKDGASTPTCPNLH